MHKLNIKEIAIGVEGFYEQQTHSTN